MLVRKITDQENYWSAKLSLCTSAAVLGLRSHPKSQSVNQKSISQPKKVVVYLCGGSGRPAHDVANLFSPKSQSVNQKSISQPPIPWGGGSWRRFPYIPPEVGGQLLIRKITDQSINKGRCVPLRRFWQTRPRRSQFAQPKSQPVNQKSQSVNQKSIKTTFLVLT